MDPKWLEWAKRLQALAQSGLNYSENPFEIERYEEIREIAAEIYAAHASVKPERVVDLFASQTGHATPKVDVRGVVFRDDAILLVREKVDGRWTLPGGWADVAETPSQATEREVFEESGYRVRAVRFVACHDRSLQGDRNTYPFHIYKLFFECELLGGEPTKSIETTDVAFFREKEVPQDLSVGRVNAKQIARLFEHHRTPDLQPDFD